MGCRCFKALLCVALAAAVWLVMPLAFSQQPPEGSLLSSPPTVGAKLLLIGKDTLLPQYVDLASGYARKRLVYIVQDANKAIRGKAEFSFGLVMESGVVRAELLKSYQFPFPGKSRLVVDAANLLPVKYTLELYAKIEELNAASAKPLETWAAEYFYDMVAVRQDSGDTGTFSSFRRPMKSLDFDEIYLLVSKLAVAKLPEKSVVLVTAPFQHRNHAALLENLGNVTIYAATAEQHDCARLRLTFVDFAEEYFVERREPNRVVKFTAGGLTFTLQDDLADLEPLRSGDDVPAAGTSSGQFLLGGGK